MNNVMVPRNLCNGMTQQFSGCIQKWTSIACQQRRSCFSGLDSVVPGAGSEDNRSCIGIIGCIKAPSASRSTVVEVQFAEEVLHVLHMHI